MKKVVTHVPRTVMPTVSHCPGCHYGNIVRVLCEVLEEMELDGKPYLFQPEAVLLCGERRSLM